jgi:hypothetical protein
MKYEDKNFYGKRELAGKTVYWDGTDSKKWYKENLKHNTQKYLLEKYNFIDKKIEYKFNKQGFRCDEFAKEDSIIFLGCSNTFGTGLNLQDTFSQKVADKYKLKNYNLGIAGGSNDSCFRVGYNWIPLLKPKFVVYGQPQQHRLSILSDNKIEINFQSNSRISYQRRNLIHWYNMFIMNDTNVLLQFEKNTMAIKQLCQTHNIPLICLEVDNYLPGDNEDRDYARDLLHYGVETNNKIAEIISKQIDRIQ